MRARALWFLSGAAAGVAGTKFAKRKVAAMTNKLRPTNVAHSAGQAAQRTGHRVVDAVREGVVSARRKERELIAQREGRLVRLADQLDDGDELYVDGEAVDTGRVIVMRQRSNRSG